MDSSQIPQGMVGLVAAASSPSSSTAKPQHHPPPPEERRPQKTPKEQPLNCPRCNSTNTKFCYYNNYSLSQPRHFCKSCKRYWTHGGSLRNVPIGGGSRKNKRAPSSTLPSPPPPKRLFLSDPMTPPLQNPNLNPNLNPIPTFVGMGGLFHAGVPLSPFVSLNSIGGHSQNMQDGGDCYGFWINGAMGGTGVGDAFGGGGT